MAYYRIVIWVQGEKRKAGIREILDENINVIQQKMEHKAKQHYGAKYIDCEVQMLARSAPAVLRYISNKAKKMENKWPYEPKDSGFTPQHNRKQWKDKGWRMGDVKKDEE